jgi:hypothetical protein
MPERLAATSPFKPVAEIIGSGPYRFLPEEHVSGARAAYERFALYQPRGFVQGVGHARFLVAIDSAVGFGEVPTQCIS